MSDTEKLAPERETAPRRYIVVVTEHAECVVHSQNWMETHKGEDGRAVMGYRTIAERGKREREVFRGENTARPRVLVPDEDGYLRLDRHTLHAQILLNLSQDRTAPSKAIALAERLYPASYPTVMNALRDLCHRGFAEKVGHGRYVARWGHVPGADA